ncbi:YeeE/YedE family protein [Endozoicomonas atrinae]|uniref:YeeE/YedE family protein n=1 Tax=Endozoicomonas atrinae TaxID=1333660 RepID=UPI000823FC67|nr:YeeE/YedE thiosulfate transporter family protein [Endozoicomonas atrinae]
MEFTIPWSSLLGGMLMGSAGLLLLLFNGKIAGISGILGGLVSPGRNDFLWRLLFIVGMIGGGWLSMQILGITFPETYNASTLIILLAGLLVGIGSGVGNGCTSGHGICGIGRLSIRSVIATCVFMAIAGITVFIRLHMV